MTQPAKKARCVCGRYLPCHEHTEVLTITNRRRVVTCIKKVVPRKKKV